MSHSNINDPDEGHLHDLHVAGSADAEALPTMAEPRRRVNDVEWINSAEALAILGIRKESFYTYVSRGLIKSEKRDGQRQRFYRKADVEKLRTRAAARSGTPTVSRLLRYGEPIVQTWISEVTTRGPRYRGQLALDLIKESRSVEFVAELIWSGLAPRLHDATWPPFSNSAELEQTLNAFPKNGTEVSPLRYFALICSTLSAMERGRLEAGGTNQVLASKHIVQTLSGVSGFLGASKCFSPPLPGESVAECVARGLGDTHEHVVAAINSALVLSAEHELSAPTFTVRICASTGADLYACIAAGVMAQSGSMQAGGTVDVEQLVSMASRLSPTDARKLASTTLPCFGHPLYDRDPRAIYLIDLMRSSHMRPAGSDSVWALIDAAEAANQRPNIFAALASLTFFLELPPGSSTLLHTLGRTIGWIAHATEQRLTGTMLRPRARYMGASAP